MESVSYTHLDVYKRQAQSLQGTVSGLRVTNTAGKPGSSPNIVLRGGASINKNLEGPLVVVDGLVRSMDCLLYTSVPNVSTSGVPSCCAKAALSR